MQRRTAVAISATAHGGLMAWALIAGLFDAEPVEDSVAVAQVSVVSAAEFDALVSRAPAEAQPEAPTAPTAPETPDTPESSAPPTPRPDAPSPAQPAPEAPAPDAPDAEPDVAALAPLPQAEVSPEVPVAPEPPADAAEAPDAPVSDTPAPAPAQRVAPTPAPAPPPDAEIAPTVEPAPEPAPTPEPQPDPEPEPAPRAPEEAAPVIVTEADRPAAAPERSVRPARRPARPAPVVAEAPEPDPDPAPAPAAETPAPTEPEPEPAPAEDPAPEPETDFASAISGALAEAVGDPVPAGGPALTQGQRDGFRLAVQNCWNLGTVSTEVMNTVITVGFEMTRDGFPRTDTIRVVNRSGGSDASAQIALERARSAIIACARQSGGYDLPEESFEQWREVEITFDPTQMRLR